MDFNHTEERQMLADMAGRFVREQYEIDTRHKMLHPMKGFRVRHGRSLLSLV